MYSNECLLQTKHSKNRSENIRSISTKRSIYIKRKKRNQNIPSYIEKSTAADDLWSIKHFCLQNGIYIYLSRYRGPWRPPKQHAPYLNACFQGSCRTTNNVYNTSYSSWISFCYFKNEQINFNFYVGACETALNSNNGHLFWAVSRDVIKI